MKTLELFLIMLFLIIVTSCTKDDEDKNELAGTYVIKRIEVSICPQAYFVDWNNDQNCVSASNFNNQYCREGLLQIKDDNSVVSSIRVVGNGPGFYGELWRLNGTGSISITGNIAQICVGNFCDDYIIDGNYLTSSIMGAGCNVSYTYKRN